MSHDSEYDRLINNKWRQAGLLYSDQQPDDKTAISGCKKLYRKAFGKAWHGKWKIAKRQNQYTWWKGDARYRSYRSSNKAVIVVNPNREDNWGRKGWPDMVHMISHMAHAQLRPTERPHSVAQLELEKDLTNYALSDAFAKYRN